MRALRIVAAIALCVGIVIAPTAATAAPVSTAAAARTVVAPGPPDDGYIPSKTKWRAFMVNVTGTILGSSTPKSWQREQLANKFAQNGLPSNEQLNAMFGYSNLTRDANGNLVPTAPRGSGTYDDAILDEYERRQNGTSNRKGQSVPATPGSKFVKGALGAGTALLGFDMGVQIGGAGTNLVGSWFGLDPRGAVCSQTADTGFSGDLLNLLSGQDCAGWKLHEDYVPNADAGEGFSQLVVGSGVVGYALRKINTPGTDWHCYSVSTATITAPSGQIFAVKTKRGDFSRIGTTLTGRTSATASSCPVGTYQSAAWEEGSTETLTMPGMYLIITGVNGNPDQVVKQQQPLSGDPDRTQSCSYTFQSGNTVTFPPSASYKESGRVVQPALCGAVPPGEVVDEVVVTENSPGGSKELYREDTTAPYKEWAEQVECGTGMCVLDLLVKTPQGAYVSCFDLEDGCVGWWEDPSKADNYTCRYGREEKPIEECALYSGLFNPGRIEVGAPYSDPLTGQWSGGTNSSSRPDRNAMGQAIQNPAATYRSCDGMNVTGFDPVGFVMRPVQCALEWAFSPRPLVIEAQMKAAENVWEGKPPAQIAAMVGNMTTSVSTTGCRRDVTIFSGEYRNPVTVLDACPGSWMEPVAIISRLLVSGSMIVLVVVVLRRQISGMVGYGAGQ